LLEEEMVPHKAEDNPVKLILVMVDTEKRNRVNLHFILAVMVDQV
jgi:hypothetical protein